MTANPSWYTKLPIFHLMLVRAERLGEVLCVPVVAAL